VRDTALPQEAARRLALMNLMVAIGPGAAPIVGGALASSLGWRSIFFALALLGIVNLLFSWRLLPESKAPALTAGLSGLARNYGRLLVSPAFLGYAVGGGCATTSMYAFVASAPFIFVQQLHRPAFEVGPYLAILILGVWLGSILASRLIAKIAMRRLMVWANMASTLAALVLLGAVLSGQLTVVLAVGSMFLFTVGVGIASPTALTQAISVNPHVIGSASGLYGFTQMAVGALCTALAGIGGNPGLAAAIVLVAAGIVAQLSFWLALRHPER
jgi:MFS transporter, DHA1 family, multidrug resistance protein